MKILEFNSKKGIYHFELSEISTKFHAHPTFEILYSEKSPLKIETKEASYESVSLAIIDKNIDHKVYGEGIIQCLMVEGESTIFYQWLNQFQVNLTDGIFTTQIPTPKADLIPFLLTIFKEQEIPKVQDERIQTCLAYFDSDLADYGTMMQLLKAKVFLSESRLSHLFKAEMGVSLKKYLVWSRLKKAFQAVIDRKLNLLEAAIESGFYDQAHLNKAFKQILGISPSDMYNSRTLQDF